jgi:hypothetical protein
VAPYALVLVLAACQTGVVPSAHTSRTQVLAQPTIAPDLRTEPPQTAAVSSTPGGPQAQPGTPAWLLSQIPDDIRPTCQSQATNQVARFSCSTPKFLIDYDLYRDRQALDGNVNQLRMNFGGAPERTCLTPRDWPCTVVSADTAGVFATVSYLKGGATSVLFADEVNFVSGLATARGGVTDDDLLQAFERDAFGILSFN